MSLLQLDRTAWLDEYFDYNPGEHVVIVEPTGGGKTTIAYQMLARVMEEYPRLSVASLMPKPKDPSTVEWARALNLRETPVWPPRRRMRDWLSPKPAGHVLWPKHRMDLPPGERREEVGKVLRAGLDAQYKKGDSISLVDDAHSAATYMGLNDYIEEILVNGRAGGAAAWLPLQKPSGTVNAGGITSYAYSSPTHLLFGKDTDKRNLDRLSEIGGGIEADRVKEIVRNLRLYRIGTHTVSQKLYIDKRGPYMALIGP
jgi:energy-coupling factor transporter ATP-binding protein EcfA2